MSAVEAVQEEEPNSWWTTLKHQGVLLSPIILEEIFPNGPPSLGEREYEKVRRSHKKFRNGSDELYNWLDVVLEDLLGHPTRSWVKETHVPAEFRRGDLSPNRVLLGEDEEARAMVWIDTDRVTTDDGEPGRIGIYSGKRTHAKLVRLLRETGTDVGILTNGHQFRVVYATLDHESWTEWDAQAWFQGGEGRGALRGFYGLLSDEVLPAPSEDEEESLIGRIEASRDRQADLSDVMGTQVREAVELLLRDLDALLMEMSEEDRETVLAPLKDLDLSRRDELRARYQAAIRIVMRLVVALYAESRELFPKDNPVYYNSYSVEGLLSDLREARIEEGEDMLEKQYSAWPRLQALSRLVYYGSPHSDIPLRAYGGRLFRPPGEDEDDDVLAGLAAFENDDIRLSDATILEVLEGLKIAEFKSGGQRRTGPVDFSDLRTEYIGMMYEGLLDYELREASEDDGAILFLNIGDQPALPFNVLENLDDKGIENLVDNLKDNASDSFLTDDKVSEDDFEEDGNELDGDEEGAADDRVGDTDELERGEFDTDLDARVHRWAKRIVEETRVYMPHFNTVRAMDPTTREKYENEAARRVVDRIIRPGGTYLVSHSGTRKSTGTFYTPPGLAVPTVHRTLEPLAYEETGETKMPKQPEEILDLQVCDPAMGSGTFPVAALRYLTDALKESFEEHVFPEVDEGDPIAAPLGDTAKGYLNERLLEIRKGENADWQDRLEMQLKRSVVERCIYGVDINPLAVELGKLSLWIETLDPKLPFTFLDHKLRVGNSLIGAWLHQFEEYPVSAWYRDGANDERLKRIRRVRDDVMKQGMKNHLKNSQHRTHWFESDPEPSELLDNAKGAFEDLHSAVDDNEREKIYHEQFHENDAIKTLRKQMDKWCSIWFWPLPDDDSPVLDPETFYSREDDREIDSIVDDLTDQNELQFFHWELEFPDVFSGSSWGFDAILMNPPWDAPENNHDEFFTRYRPHYRTLNTTQAEKLEENLLNNYPHIRDRWLTTVRNYKSQSHYFRNTANPFDLKLGRSKRDGELVEQFQERIHSKIPKRYREEMPYEFRGTRTNYYQFFTEKSFKLIQEDGRLGFLSPRGIYTDASTEDLRKHLLERSSWDWLFGIENRDLAFPIDSRFKYCMIILTKGGETDTIQCSFMVNDTGEWMEDNPIQTEYSLEQIQEYSPFNYAMPELVSERDRRLFDKIYSDSSLMNEYDDGLNIEFYLDKDSKLMESRKSLTKKDIQNTSSTEFRTEDGETYYPVYAGAMVEQFDFLYNEHVSGKKWNNLSHSEKRYIPKYFMKKEDYLGHDRSIPKVKLSFRKITSPTNNRTVLSSLVPPLPCILGNYFVTLPDQYRLDLLVFDAIVNSYVFDYTARIRIPDTDVIWYWLREMPIPDIEEEKKVEIAGLVADLNWHPDFFPDVSEFTEGLVDSSEYITDESERALAREKLDELIANAYGLSQSDMEWILRPSSDDPRSLYSDYEKRLELLGGDGTWGSIDSEGDN